MRLTDSSWVAAIKTTPLVATYGHVMSMMLADSLYGMLQDTSNIMRLTESSRVPRTEDIKTTRPEIDIGLSL